MLCLMPSFTNVIQFNECKGNKNPRKRNLKHYFFMLYLCFSRFISFLSEIRLWIYFRRFSEVPPLFLLCASVPKSVQTRCKVGEDTIIERRFNEFGTEDKRYFYLSTSNSHEDYSSSLFMRL